MCNLSPAACPARPDAPRQKNPLHIFEISPAEIFLDKEKGFFCRFACQNWQRRQGFKKVTPVSRPQFSNYYSVSSRLSFSKSTTLLGDRPFLIMNLAGCIFFIKGCKRRWHRRRVFHWWATYQAYTPKAASTLDVIFPLLY